MKIRKPKRYYLKSRTVYFQIGKVVDFDNIRPDHYWYKIEFDCYDNEIYSEGCCIIREYDTVGNLTYYKIFNESN